MVWHFYFAHFWSGSLTLPYLLRFYYWAGEMLFCLSVLSSFSRWRLPPLILSPVSLSGSPDHPRWLPPLHQAWGSLSTFGMKFFHSGSDFWARKPFRFFSWLDDNKAKSQFICSRPSALYQVPKGYLTVAHKGQYMDIQTLAVSVVENSGYGRSPAGVLVVGFRHTYKLVSPTW